jgi:hypothetical protein
MTDHDGFTKNDVCEQYFLVNVLNGEAVGVFANSISARMALDTYLKLVFSTSESSHVDIDLYRLHVGGGAVAPNRLTFTRDNHRMLLSATMI